MGKMDPFVDFEMVDENKKSLWKAKTLTHKGGHQTPEWNQEFTIEV
jgi:hypothetical protein